MRSCLLISLVAVGLRQGWGVCSNLYRRGLLSRRFQDHRLRLG